MSYGIGRLVLSQIATLEEHQTPDNEKPDVRPPEDLMYETYSNPVEQPPVSS
jgi:hypothetical protein